MLIALVRRNAATLSRLAFKAPESKGRKAAANPNRNPIAIPVPSSQSLGQLHLGLGLGLQIPGWNP